MLITLTTVTKLITLTTVSFRRITHTTLQPNILLIFETSD
jgi:hypothetical protein